MAGQIENAGAEETAAWVFTGNADYSTAQAHAGARSLRIRSLEGVVGGITHGIARNVVTTERNVRAGLSAWVYLDAGGLATESDLVCEYQLAGSWLEVGRIHSPDYGAAWQLVEFGDFIAADGQHGFRFRSNLDASGGLQSVTWHVDDVSAEIGGVGAAVISRAIRDALIEDLQQITIANGYEITVEKIYPEPIEREKAVSPAIVLIPFEGGSSETDTLGSRHSEAEETFSLQLYTASASPFDDLLRMRDSVANAVERSDSVLGAIAEVDEVDVVNWSAVLTSEDIANLWAAQEVDVRVKYHYRRGAR